MFRARHLILSRGFLQSRFKKQLGGSLNAREFHSAFPSPSSSTTGSAVILTTMGMGTLALSERGVSMFSTVAATDGAKAASSSPAKIVLYQYEICPFCNKLKAVMDYLNISYETIEVNPLSKEELKFSPDYRKVPIMTVDGEQINDSPVIMDKIIEVIKNQGHLNQQDMDNLMGGERCTTWLKWADEKLAVLVFPNLCATLSQSYNAFDYVNEVEKWGLLTRLKLQLAGGVAMRLANGKIKKKYGIEDEKADLIQALDTWVNEVGEANFHGGEKPNLADLAVFGVLRSVHRTDTYTMMMDSTQIGPWYTRMEELVHPK